MFSSCVVGCSTLKRGPQSDVFFCSFGVGESIFWMNERNSRLSKILRSVSRLGADILSASRSRSIGTSVLIVTRNFENSICSLFSSTFFFNAPFSSSVRASRLSIDPNCVMSFTAVFSPTPGQPGTLSDVSPIRPSRSITCVVDSMPYFSHTSFSPIFSMPADPWPGRSM